MSFSGWIWNRWFSSLTFDILDLAFSKAAMMIFHEVSTPSSAFLGKDWESPVFLFYQGVAWRSDSILTSDPQAASASTLHQPVSTVLFHFMWFPPHVCGKISLASISSLRTVIVKYSHFTTGWFLFLASPCLYCSFLFLKPATSVLWPLFRVA